MILEQKTKSVLIRGFLNGKNLLISLMGAIFYVFASGAKGSLESNELISILVGTSLFTIASGILIWARDISKKFYS